MTRKASSNMPITSALYGPKQRRKGPNRKPAASPSTTIGDQLRAQLGDREFGRLLDQLQARTRKPRRRRRR